MRINLEGIGRSVWVPWRDGVEYLIKPATLTKIQKIRSHAIIHNVTGRGADRAVTEDLDMGKFIRGVAELIEDWRGVYDKNDKEVKCTPELKVQMLDCFAGTVGIKGEEEEESLTRFITEQAQILTKNLVQKQEVEKENFLDT